jgi:16S rRNA (cytosine967-C5)-methyltransferase
LKKNIIPENVRAIRQGLASIQAPSSGWVVALLEAERGDKILDVCSSPGGKAAMLSELADESGSVCACDIRLQRLMMTVDTARRMHLDNVYAVAADGCRPPFDGVFDKVLVDAPCSATGVMHRHPEARWMRKDSDFDALAATQRRLLASAANLVGPGGTIVYATCSLEPEENALQVQWFLRDYPHFSHIGCPASIPQSYVDNSGYLFITPFAHGIDGMFGARLRRMK